MSSEIVKVQRPLMTNDPLRAWLVYDKRRKRERHVPESQIPEKVRSAMGLDFKAYFNAEWHSEAGWQFGDRAKTQDW